ncbi:hypothetical protein [Saliphagus infecundisoli]|uniref:Uncharacterized protein n=2 Tax=Saliphagus infecundisoli TaxID=1849069 RepID=A0ABD5QHR0_9EURY|nr:hypothetical protein [Saliphagus infecundisoli]
MGIYQTDGEFFLVPTFEGSSAPELGGGGGARPSEKHEYSFDEEERMWFATETISYGAASLVGELEPDETRSREIVLIRRPHKEFPETVPSEFEFATEFGVDDEDSEGITDYQHTIAFSLVATQ